MADNEDPYFSKIESVKETLSKEALVEDPNDIYSVDYVTVPLEAPAVPPNPDDASGVRGTFRKIEEAGGEYKELRCNHSIMFLGMVCPIVDEDATRVKIIHGHSHIWIPKEKANKVLSSKQKQEGQPWRVQFKNPQFPK